MSPIYLYNGKLLIRDNKLTADPNCCCTSGCPVSTCISISCADYDLYTEIDCKRDGIHIHTIGIPEEYTLPVKVNIAGSVDDDLLINGQSASDLGYDPGPYIGNGECIVAHTIGEIPLQNDPNFPQGNQDPNKYPSITFPHNNQSFTVAARDTELSVHALNITICLDPYNEQNVCLPPTVSGCCGQSGLYCFEKTIDRSPSEPCVTYLCATGVPEGESGWSQISGPFDCQCTGCPPTGVCVGYTEWKIIDQDNYVYGTGIIVYDNDGGKLNDFPNPFTPIHYGIAGSKNFDLQAKCGGITWHTIYEWDGDIILCSGSNDRYPSNSFTSAPWAPQGACAEKINQNGDVICDTNGTSEGCPLLSPGTLGNGIDPDNGVAYKFVGTSDTEWTNLNNWEDASGFSPAGSLPGDGDDVLIAGTVNKIPNDYFSSNSIILNNITVNSAGSLGVSLSCANLLCDSGQVYGSDSCSIPTITISNTCEFINGGFLQDADITISASPVKFRTGSSVDRSTITGNAEFYDNSSATEGTVTGNVIFYDTSSMGSNFAFNGSGDFYNTSTRQSSTMYFSHSTVTFHDSSKNYGFMESAIFTDSSINETTGSVANDATFSDNSKNRGNVGGTATFTDSACNDGGTAGTFIPPDPSC